MATVFTPLPSPAADKLWYKYENDFFEVYSDASEKQVRKIVEELEEFRAAAVQILSISIPDDAQKTRLIIFRKSRDLKDTVGGRSIAGLAIWHDRIPYMIMQGKRDKYADDIVRHEYMHIVMAYSPVRYPPWLKEGFAEFMSSTEFKKNGTEFRIGYPIGRRLTPNNHAAWSALISDGYRFHSGGTVESRSNAYFQAWILAHYMLLGERLANNQKFANYLGLFDAGVESADALQQSFGQTADEIGEHLLDDYVRNVAYYYIAFKDGIVDREFTRTEADQDEIQRIIGEIAARRSGS